MDKIKNWITTHKVWTVLGGISLIALIIILIILIMMFMGSSSSKYGHRLDGIEDVAISSDTKDSIKNIQSDSVTSSDIRIQGKIIYINIHFTEGTTLADAKNVAKDTLQEFSEDEVKFYDICYFLVEDKDEGYIATGTKHPDKEEISWIKE